MKSSQFNVAATCALLFGAVVFGMVLAGALDLTPETFGAALLEQEEAQQRFADPVAASANAQIQSFADLAEAVLPAVVTVHATTIESIGEDRGGDFFRFMPGREGRAPRERSSRGVGSGFLISPDGWLVTNHHVIDGATSVEVTIGEEGVKAEVKGFDQTTDLAVLKIEGDGYPFLELGDSERLRVGDWVMAVGSPLGIGSSVTVGVVSAKGRILGITGDQAFDDFIQTDAAINRGNSGGPLLNTRGQVVGVATAMNYAAENIGFAVSSKILMEVVPQLRGRGRVARGYLGVAIRDLDEDLVASLRGVESTNGALITSVEAAPARTGGLKELDVVVTVDGRSIADVAELISRVSRRQPGESVELGIVRRGKDLAKTIVLGDRQQNLVPTPIELIQEPQEGNVDWLDTDVRELDRELRDEMRLEQKIDGVVLQRIGASSLLTEKGLRPYDIVREVNGVAVKSVSAFERAIAAVESGDRLVLFIHSPTRGGFQDLVVIRVP